VRPFELELEGRADWGGGEAPPEVLRPKATAPLGASRRAWLAAERRQTCMLRKLAEAPERAGRTSLFLMKLGSY
jgi:hypothetical protein